MLRESDPQYPKWICECCGENYGTWYKKGSYVGPPYNYPTYRQGNCQVCGANNVLVTEPKQYGHLHSKWRADIIRKGNSN
jgi:hypothetical protein